MSGQYTVECKCCLVRDSFSDGRVAQLAYSFHDEHYGSSLTEGEDSEVGDSP